jgi:D-glycero-alpha-D-manno-heptose-7-phosphate kinase
VLNEAWCLKRGLASKISNPQIDGWYEAAVRAGSLGGKLCGAGGGGFLLFIVPPGRREAVRRALGGLVELSVQPEVHGSRMVVPFNG